MDFVLIIGVIVLKKFKFFKCRWFWICFESKLDVRGFVVIMVYLFGFSDVIFLWMIFIFLWFLIFLVIYLENKFLFIVRLLFVGILWIFVVFKISELKCVILIFKRFIVFSGLFDWNEFEYMSFVKFLVIWVGVFFLGFILYSFIL